MRIVVFGASGGCGRHAVLAAARRGHDVTAVLRPSSSHRPPHGVRVVRAEVTDPAAIRATIAEQDAVLSCLGLRRASPFPWAPLLSPPDLVTTFTRALASAMVDSSVSSVLWISAGGVGDSRSHLTGLIRVAIDAGNVAVAYRDLAGAEAAMPPGDDRWLAVRPVTLVDGPPTGRPGPVTRYGAFSVVRRSDVGAWMVDVADGTRPFRPGTVLLGTVPGG